VTFADEGGQAAGDRVSTVWPGVSVVMPVLNEERHLDAAIRRVLDQDYPGELEVVLAVGPSSDRTHEIALALAAADPRIRVVDNPAAHTPVALNLGIAAAKHEIIARVDGHGELTDGYIRRAVELLDETGAANVGGLMDAQGAELPATDRRPQDLVLSGAPGDLSPALYVASPGQADV
jgi:succinoglycan biosynthesis protein ExoA